MKRYIKSSVNIHQNLSEMSYDDFRYFLDDLEIGTTIEIETHYNGEPYPEIYIYRKEGEYTWMYDWCSAETGKWARDKWFGNDSHYLYTEVSGGAHRVTISYGNDSYTIYPKSNKSSSTQKPLTDKQRREIAQDKALDGDVEIINEVNVTPDFVEIKGEIGGDYVTRRYYNDELEI